MTFLCWALPSLSLALRQGAIDSHTLSDWPGDALDLCQVSTGLQVLPGSTCADFALGSSIGAQPQLAEAPATCRVNMTIQALKGETEAAQMLFRLPSTLTQPRNGTIMKFMGFEAVPSGVDCQVSQVGYVFTNVSGRISGSGGGWRPDPLREWRQPVGVPVNTAQPIWISCSVSTEAVAGHYDSQVWFHLGLLPGEMKICFGLHLEIWNASIPSLQHSEIGAAWRGFWRSEDFEEYYGPDYWEKNKQKWFELMAKHRTPPDMVQKYPRPLEDFISISKMGTRWFCILDTRWYASKQEAGCAVYSDSDIKVMLETIEPTWKALKAHGLEQWSYVYGFDEVPSNCEPALRQVFGAVKRAFPELKTMAAINWPKVASDLPLDVWVLQYQLFDEFGPAISQNWTKTGKELWLYHCIEPEGLRYLNTFVERPTVQGRLLFWLAALWEIEYGRPTGWLYYEMNVWWPCASPDCGEPAQKHPIVWESAGDLKETAFTDWPEANFIWRGQFDRIFANGDGQFVYPCTDGPCGGVRLAALRDGLEDWELFRQLGKPALPLIRQLVRGPKDWRADVLRLQELRAEAAKMLADKRARELLM